MEHTYIIWALSFSLFCQASEPNKSVTSLMDEYNNSFKPQSETENKTQGRKFGRGSSGPGEGELFSTLIDSREEIIRKINTLNSNVRELQESRRAIIGRNMNAKEPAEHTEFQVALLEMIDTANRDIKQLEEELKKYNKAKL